MSTLHTVNKSPSTEHIDKCLSLVMPGDAILLIEDGVYCIQLTKKLLSHEGIKLYCLQEDLIARGLVDKKPSEIETVNSNGFVDLCIRHDRCMNWF